MEVARKKLEAEVAVVKGVGTRRYVVCYLIPLDASSQKSRESVTFSLSIWEDTEEPLPGQRVWLEGIKKFRGGWRASHASPILLAA